MSVVNVKKKVLKSKGYVDFSNWNSKDHTVYIGRNMTYLSGPSGSKWGNPYTAKKYGRARCLEMYKEYILGQKNLMNSLHELEGKELGCWCKPDACHGDILVALCQCAQQKSKACI
jgi:hypothetical protein